MMAIVKQRNKLKSDYVFKTKKGLNKDIVLQIAEQKNEPGWMIDFRLNALKIFESMPMPTWGADLTDLNINDIYYYLKPLAKQHTSWDDVPDKIKTTFEKLGIPQAERQLLAGVGAQYESEVIYSNLKKTWADKGVVFMDTSRALQEFPDLFKKYFATIIPPHDNKFAALNSAVWSGGSFVYIPKGVHVDMPSYPFCSNVTARSGPPEATKEPLHNTCTKSGVI